MRSRPFGLRSGKKETPAEGATWHDRRLVSLDASDLEQAIYDYLILHNAKPKPFVWTKSAEDILRRERRALDAFDALDDIRGNR